MFSHMLVIGIPMLVVSIFLCILYCYLALIHKRGESQNMRQDSFPSVYVIPMFDEQVVDVQEAPRLFPERDPPIYCSRGVSPPPPYGPETPPYQDPPPSYWDPPAYSELQ